MLLAALLIGLVAALQAIVRVFTQLDNQVVVVASGAAPVSVVSLIVTGNLRALLRAHPLPIGQSERPEVAGQLDIPRR